MGRAVFEFHGVWFDEVTSPTRRLEPPRLVELGLAWPVNKPILEIVARQCYWTLGLQGLDGCSRPRPRELKPLDQIQY